MGPLRADLLRHMNLPAPLARSRAEVRLWCLAQSRTASVKISGRHVLQSSSLRHHATQSSQGKVELPKWTEPPEEVARHSKDRKWSARSCQSCLASVHGCCSASMDRKAGCCSTSRYVYPWRMAATCQAPRASAMLPLVAVGACGWTPEAVEPCCSHCGGQSLFRAELKCVGSPPWSSRGPAQAWDAELFLSRGADDAQAEGGPNSLLLRLLQILLDVARVLKRMEPNSWHVISFVVNLFSCSSLCLSLSLSLSLESVGLTSLSDDIVFLHLTLAFLSDECTVPLPDGNPAKLRTDVDCRRDALL